MSSRRAASSNLRCPACGGALADKHDRCPHCRFTGQDTMTMFSGAFSPFDPVRDAAGLWDDKELADIGRRRHKLRKRFPQIRFYVETVLLPPETSLPLYGFWRLNTAPFAQHESTDHRTWAVLLVIDATSGRASVTCGYRMGHWVADKEWQAALEKSQGPWAKKGSAAGVLTFFKHAAGVIEKAWYQKVIRPD